MNIPSVCFVSVQLSFHSLELQWTTAGKLTNPPCPTDMIRRRSLRTRAIKMLVLDEADEMLNKGEQSDHITVQLKLWEAAVCLSFHLLMLMFRFQGADLRRVPLPASCHTGGSDQCHAAAWDLGNDQQVHDWPDSYPGETVSPAELSLLRSYRCTKGWTVKTICLIRIFFKFYPVFQYLPLPCVGACVSFSLVCVCVPVCLLPSVMSWLWRELNSSLLPWRERSGSLTHCVTFTTHSPSHKPSSSVTRRERSDVNTGTDAEHAWWCQWLTMMSVMVSGGLADREDEGS